MTSASLRNPYLVIVASLTVLVLGLVSYFGMPQAGIRGIPSDLLPQFNTSAVQIVCFYPGMPPEVMEKDIMSRLQRWTGQSVGIEHQEAKAMQGVCVVKDFFREGVPMSDAMAQVSSYAMSDMFYLPPGTIPPMVMPFDPTASVPLCLVVVSNSEMDEQQLYDIAYYELRNKLQSIQGVIAPAVYGGKLRRILAYVEAKKLESHGLSLMDVQQALLKQNVLIPAGNIKIGRQDLQIFTNAIPEKIDDLNYTPIGKGKNGEIILMNQVGTVENASQIQSNIVRINGSRQAYIPIYRQPGANTIDIVRRIREQLASITVRLQNERAEDPRMKSLVLSVAMDQSLGVQKSINSLWIAALLGAALAGLAVAAFLRSIRLTFVVLLSIPLAVLAAISGLFFTRGTINAMTLGGLALAIGILVDQSIVVLENIVRHVHMGKKPAQAALDGTREVALPILISTITFAVVFFPVVFLSGLAKFLFTPLAVSACIAIFASFILSITLVPAFCASFLSPVEADRESEHGGALARWYASILDWVLTFRFPVVGAAIVAFVLAIGWMFNMGQELFPSVDSGQVTIYVRMPTGTRIEITEQSMIEIEKVITAEIGKLPGDEGPGQTDPGFAVGNEKYPRSNLQLLISNIGVLMDWPAAYTPNNGPMDGFMLVHLKGKAGHPDVFTYVERLREKLNQQFNEGKSKDEKIEFAFDTGGMMTAALNMGEPSPIHFQVRGQQLEDAQTVALLIKNTAETVPGTADVRVAQRIDYPIKEVIMDRELAAKQGLTPDDVMKNLVAATNSSINFEPTFWIDKHKGNHYFFGVQYREEDLNSEETLRNIPVGGTWDMPRRLGNVAEIRDTTGPAVVFHRNISRVTDVYANVRPGYDVGSIVSAIERKLNRMGIQPGTDDRGSLNRLGPMAIDETSDSEATRRAKAEHNQLPLARDEFKGMSYRMMGEVRSMRQSFVQFSGGLLIAAVLVYLVMVAQFKSFVDPLVVLLTVPLGFIGVVLALTLTGTHLSIMAFMGIIMMTGIVVEYSIVLVDFANHRVEQGLGVREAILEAARTRLRPILMTSLTTWLALLPMAFPGLLSVFGLDTGGTNAPLARAIIGGVLSATVLSLLVVPCLYVMMKRPPREQDDDDEQSLQLNPAAS